MHFFQGVKDAAADDLIRDWWDKMLAVVARMHDAHRRAIMSAYPNPAFASERFLEVLESHILLLIIILGCREMIETLQIFITPLTFSLQLGNFRTCCNHNVYPSPEATPRRRPDFTGSEMGKLQVEQLVSQ
ncbi:hypothetical protein Y032_0057g2755 [Ancylostoma ceylanicum]|uniref:Uncharacterized protein n=1 Tax=Ancylostoma ceylanicum TaxID=53326 RepID=A0A016U595_9BILA|nr:hypothetical protein Y032_0057g2755 [Ancylostoma ceylanicum]